MARAVGCQQICVITNWVEATISNVPRHLEFPVIRKSQKHEMLDRLADEGIGVSNIEFFPIAADTDVQSYRPSLELGRELGAQRAVVHIFDLDDARATDRLGQLCELGAELDLVIGVEFMGMTPACNSIGRAIYFVEAAAQSNLGIGVDALHLVRTGGTVSEIAALSANVVVYAQICD